MTPTERRAAFVALAATPNDQPRLVLATGRYIGEGFDDARLDTLFLAMPVCWKGTLVQYTGRLHRLYPGKTEVRIYDYVDREVPCMKNARKRALLSSEFYGNYPILAASLVLFSVPVLVLYFLFQQQFIEGLTAGAR